MRMRACPLLFSPLSSVAVQAAEPMPLAELNDRMTKLLATLPTQTREQFLAAADDEDDQDN
jgi:hypothetical protein